MKHTKILIGIVLILVISIPAFLYFIYTDKPLTKNTSSTINIENKETDTNDSNNNSNSNNSTNDSSSRKTKSNTTSSTTDTTGSSASTVTYNMTYLSLNDFASSLSCVNYTIKEGDTLKIPESTFVSGTLYKIKDGDSWYKIRDTYYKNYDIDNFMNFIIDLNELPNDMLPLGETIFLPALRV